MARPTKTGLDYWPRDVDLQKDRKFRRAKLLHGYVSCMVYEILLDMIFKDRGYYIDYNEKTKDDVVWEVLENLQGKYQPTARTIEEVIEILAECELFSHDCFKSKILTSKRIQRTYYKCTVDRKAFDIDYDIWLLNEEEMRQMSGKSIILSNFVNRTNNEVNGEDKDVDVNDNTQSKVKESKVNKSRVNESKVNESRVNEIKRNESKEPFSDALPKNEYGEYKNVLLTDDEYNKLITEYTNTDELIKCLDEYIEMKGYTYNSCYLAIKKWVVDAVNERKNKNSNNDFAVNKDSFNHDELEKLVWENLER